MALCPGLLPSASASVDTSLNGTYAALSNGQWATSNLVYHDEAVVRSTWTVHSTCVSPVDCAGQVTSDLGWTAPIYTRNGQWFVKNPIPGWVKCEDGTTAPGLQIFKFYSVDSEGYSGRIVDDICGCGFDVWPQRGMWEEQATAGQHAIPAG